MKPEIEEELEQQATAFIRQRVLMGFEDQDEIHGKVLDYLENACDFDVLEPYLGQLTKELLAAHRVAQQSWPAETDCDQLDFAFLLLEEEQGIVARQHFTGCLSDGHHHIWPEVRGAQQRGPVKGYVFYHQQDTERAVARGELYLAFAAVEENDAAAAEVASCIVKTLQEVGLSAGWNGNPRERILVSLNWQKRRLEK